MKYECKPVKYSIFPEGKNPIYDDLSVMVEVDDEAAGPFLRIATHGEELSHGQIELEFQQWAAIDKAARQLIKDFGYE